MALAGKIAEDLKEAMKAKDEFRLSCLRMLKTALKYKEAERGQPPTDEEVCSVISSLIRKGQEAAAEFRKGNREDLAHKEEEEVKFLFTFLPQQATPAEIEAALREVIVELSAQGTKDLGRVMKAAMAKLAGKAQGKQVSEMAKRLLT